MITQWNRIGPGLSERRPEGTPIPGGWIALADLDAEDGTFHADPTGIYHHGFERITVCRWLERAGFTGASSREAYRITRPGSDGVARTYPVFLVTAQAG